MRKPLLAIALALTLLLLACGTGTSQFEEKLAVGPQDGSASHMYSAPSNSVTFYASIALVCPAGRNCGPTPEMPGTVTKAHWTSSDPFATSVSNNPDGSATVTCRAASSAPILVTATAPSERDAKIMLTASAQLMCN